jgi:hypothetical protein
LSEISTKETLFLDEQATQDSQGKLFSVDVFVQKLIIYARKNVWKSGRNILGSFIRMSYPKRVLRASIKVGNEEKFFAMPTSLLDLEDGFLCSAMHTTCYSGEVIFGLSSEMRNSSGVTFVDCFIVHKGRFIDDVLQSFVYLQYKHRGQGKNKTQYWSVQISGALDSICRMIQKITGYYDLPQLFIFKKST